MGAVCPADCSCKGGPSRGPGLTESLRTSPGLLSPAAFVLCRVTAAHPRALRKRARGPIPTQKIGRAHV